VPSPRAINGPDKSQSPDQSPVAKLREHVLAMEVERRQRKIDFEIEEPDTAVSN
jgi:hypothetical protein